MVELGGLLATTMYMTISSSASLGSCSAQATKGPTTLQAGGGACAFAPNWAKTTKKSSIKNTLILLAQLLKIFFVNLGQQVGRVFIPKYLRLLDERLDIERLMESMTFTFEKNITHY